MTELSHFSLRLPQGEWCLIDHHSKRANIQRSLHLSTIHNIFFETQSKMKGLVFFAESDKIIAPFEHKSCSCIYKKNSCFIILASTRKKNARKLFSE